MIFKNILSCPISLQEEVRNWRNHYDIRKNMYNDTIVSKDEHKQWLASLRNSNINYVYIAFDTKDPIGIVSINNYKPQWLTADWAFYLNPNCLLHKGLGASLEYHFLNYIFDVFKIQKLNCEVLQTNPLVIKLHQKFGFAIEGTKRSNVLKNNDRVDVILLGILCEEWYKKRSTLKRIINKIEQHENW